MIKRIFLLIPLLVLIISCSGFEFVYNIVGLDNIKEKTLFSISGDNKDVINSYLLSKIGKGESAPTYVLSIVSSESIEAAVIETDATASKFVVKHDLKYILNNISKNCIIVEKEISTENFYDAKSAGYSFGTDLAEKELSTKELSERNLHSNIDQFLDELSINYSDLKCNNEG